MPEHKHRLRELALIFLRLGATSFGGPAAHIALMEQEFVQKRGWLDRQHFLDLVGATNIIPGPNSTELAIYIGQQRAGRAGLWVAGACFIFPAVVIVLAIAWFYQRFGALPAVEAMLRGIAPVVVAIVAQALWKFADTALKTPLAIAVAVGALALQISGVPELAIIALAALAGLAFGFARRKPAPCDDQSTKLSPAFFALAAPGLVANKVVGLFFVFLKIGSIIYGSGYVLLAYLRSDLVERLGWISDKQLLDAVAVGQMTTGPVFTTATFIGYNIAGLPGAFAATLGIFLPSFVFVGLLASLLDKVKTSPLLRAFLDSVNAASLALMAAVTWQLAKHALWPGDVLSLPALALALLALIALLRTKINSAWLILAGALCGFLWM